MIKRLTIFLSVILFSTAVFAAAPDNFFATCLTGGTTGCLDAVDVTNDGIDNADAAYVKTSAAVYLYNFNSTSGAAEDSPDVIAPDNDAGVAYSGDGRWILIGIYGATIQLATGVQIAEFSDDGTMSGNSDTAAPTEKAVRTYADALPSMPTGSVITFAGKTCPSGYLEANGQAVSQETYATLYSTLDNGSGTCIYGESDGNFNVPNYAGKFLRGYDHGEGNDPDAGTRTDAGDGTTTGDNVGTQQADQYESHSHTLGAKVSGSGSNIAGDGGSWYSQNNNTGSSGGNETRPINVSVLYCIKY